MNGFEILGIAFFYSLIPVAWTFIIRAILGFRNHIIWNDHIKATHKIYGYPLRKLHNTYSQLQLNYYLEILNKKNNSEVNV